MGTGIFIREVAFPPAVRAVSVPNSDGTFDIYVNSALSEQARQAALRHELNHIRQDHFYDHDPVWLNESAAGG